MKGFVSGIVHALFGEPTQEAQDRPKSCQAVGRPLDRRRSRRLIGTLDGVAENRQSEVDFVVADGQGRGDAEHAAHAG
jgi:hypothetical protein